MSEFIEYVQSIQGQILSLSWEHVELTLFSVILAIAIGVPLGILISYLKKLTKPVLGIANIVQAIPSLALLGFAIPFLGIGSKPAIFMVILYSLLPIIKNTYTGIQSIPDQTLEAAKGIGMTRAQILIKVQIPMALPIIMAGEQVVLDILYIPVSEHPTICKYWPVRFQPVFWLWSSIPSWAFWSVWLYRRD